MRKQRSLFASAVQHVSPMQPASALPKAMGLAIHDRSISQPHTPEPARSMKSLELIVERIILSSRWLLVVSALMLGFLEQIMNRLKK